MIIEEKVGKIILKNSRVKPQGFQFDDKTNLVDELGYDSITFIKLILELENEFEIEFGMEIGLDEISSYKKICDYIISIVK